MRGNDRRRGFVIQNNYKIMIKINKKNGYALITAVVFFLSATSVFVFGAVGTAIREISISRDVLKGKESYFLSESGMEDAIYRLKKGKQISTSETLNLNGNSVNTVITSISGGKEIISEGEDDGYIRKVKTKVLAGTGVAFNYGVQTGQGGFFLGGGSMVNGNVYSNGSIISTDGAEITGSAIAANVSAMIADQKNESPSVPPYSILFAKENATQDFGQSFEVSASDKLNKISFYIKKVGNPSGATVRVLSGSLTGTEIANGSLNSSLVTANYGWVNVAMNSNPVLNIGTTYWIMIDGSANASNYYIIGANSSYDNGQAKIGRNSTWINTTPTGLDGYFAVYIGGTESKIGGGTWAGAIRVGGDAWANTVTGAFVTGALYCQSGINNNKVCNTSKTDPSPQNMPISDGNIDVWKDEALSGGTYNGNYSVGWAGATIGPKKINGNLTISGGGILNITGTLWVTGNIILGGGGQIKLSSSYGVNSGIIVVDGTTNLGGGGGINGSGQTGSYILIVSTSVCDGVSTCGTTPAILVGGGASAVILNAQNGTINIGGGANLKEATANKITLSGGAVINYESGLADIKFTSGPSGGYTINSWNEVE